jgi:enoyl-[acyl-carrier protein] reductase I
MLVFDEQCETEKTAGPRQAMGLFTGKVGLVMGVANDRSIAWAMTEALYREKAELAFTFLPAPSSERRVRALVEPHSPKVVLPCDVQKDQDIAAVFKAIEQAHGRLDFVIHSVAFAPPSELKKPYVECNREGWHLAMDISVYSLVSVCREAAPLMRDGGSIVTISYFGGEKVMPGYNMMGVCKAALEHSVRYLAWDLGRKNIRVNAISAGPMRTLSSAGVSRFDEMRDHAERKSPLGRNLEPEELGNTGLYLLSDLSSGMTGEILHVDCGYNIVGL